MPTERPSRTAMKIARFIVLLDAQERLRAVLPEGAAAAAERILRASGAVSAGDVDFMRAPGGRRLYRWAERLTGRGQVLWFGVRKRWVAETVEAALRDGARQLLVIGGGLDPLAALAAQRHPDVLCVEIDAPGTARPKAAGVRGAGLERPNHLVCPVDLSRDALADALARTPWRPEAKSVVVAEGVLMYLAPADAGEFFRKVRACTGPGTRLAFTAMDADARGRPCFGSISGFARLALRLAGEPIRWALRPGDAGAYLAPAGWRLREQPSVEDLRQRFLEPVGLKDEPVSRYDWLALAEAPAA